MKRNLMLLATVTLAAGVLAAGCGGDDDSSDLTHEEFVTQANEICKQGNAEIEGSAPDGVRPGTPEFDAFVTDTLAPIIEGQISDIRDLGIPEQDESLNATLDEADQITEEIAADPISITKGDPYASINDELAAAGLTECADG